MVWTRRKKPIRVNFPNLNSDLFWMLVLRQTVILFSVIILYVLVFLKMCCWVEIYAFNTLVPTILLLSR